MRKSNRTNEKRIAKQEVQGPKTVESAVSQVLKERQSRTIWGKDLLKMTASYVTDAHRMRERQKSWKAKGYPTGTKIAATEEKYVRAAVYVAKHERFKEYLAVFYEVYVGWTDAAGKPVPPNPYSVERMSEFETMLDTTLDKVPFVAERRDDVDVKEADDCLNALIPVTLCAKLLGIGRRTLHRWLDDGLRAELVGDKSAVQKKGAYYFVNYLAALKWKSSHYQPGKARKVA